MAGRPKSHRGNRMDRKKKKKKKKNWVFPFRLGKAYGDLRISFLRTYIALQVLSLAGGTF